MNVTELYFLVVLLTSPIHMNDETTSVVAFPFPTYNDCMTAKLLDGVEDILNDAIQSKYPDTSVQHVRGCMNYEDTLEALEVHKLLER